MNQCMFAWAFMQLIRDNIKAIYILSHDEGCGRLYDDLIKYYSRHRGHMPWLKGEANDSQGDFSKSFSLDSAIGTAIGIALDILKNPDMAPWLQMKIADLKADCPHVLFGEAYQMFSMKKLKENLELGKLPGSFSLQRAHPYTILVDTVVSGYDNYAGSVKFDTSEVKDVDTFKDLIEALRKSRNKLKKDLEKLLKDKNNWLSAAKIKDLDAERIEKIARSCISQIQDCNYDDRLIFAKNHKEELIRAFVREINKL